MSLLVKSFDKSPINPVTAAFGQKAHVAHVDGEIGRTNRCRF